MWTLSRPSLAAILLMASAAITACAPSPSYAQPPVRTLSAELAAGADWRSYADMRLFQETIDPTRLDKNRLNAACYHETNARRVSQGLKALPYHEALESAAQIYAEVMVRDNFFAHHHPTNASLRAPEDRGRAAGILNPKLAENIAITIGLRYRSGETVYPRGQGRFSRTPDGPIIPMHTYASFAREVLDQWMASPGHRKNILAREAVALGCGASFFWQDGFPAFKAVQNFQFFEPVRAPNTPVASPPRRAEPVASAPEPDRLSRPQAPDPPTTHERPRQSESHKVTTKVTTTRQGDATIRKTVIIRERDGVKEIEEIVETTRPQATSCD